MNENEKKKTIIIILLVVCAFCVTIEGRRLFEKIVASQHDVVRYDINLERFEPFGRKSKLKNYDTNFKIMDNYPKINAASAFYPFAATLVQNLYDKTNYDSSYVTMVSTNDGFDAISNGSCDILISTEPSEEQMERLIKSEADLEYIPICKEKLEVINNLNNPISNLSIEQLREIYEGKINSWSSIERLGIEEDRDEIHTYTLEKNNGSRTCFDKVVPDAIIDEKCHFKATSMDSIITNVGEDKNGLCYAFDSYYWTMIYDFRTKRVKIDGKSIEDEDYPLQFDVYLIYNKNSDNPNVQKLVDYITSEDGKEFIKEVREV